MDRVRNLDLSNAEELYNLGICLTSTLKRKILIALSKESKTILELAEMLNVPLSTMSTNLKALYDAKIIKYTKNPKSHGSEKVVSLSTMQFNIDMSLTSQFTTIEKVIEIPIGSFSSYNINAPCGLADKYSEFMYVDNPDVFMSPLRHKAQIIWFSSGYLEYKIPTFYFENNEIESLSFSLELCSECPNHRNDWKSEVTFSLNNKEIAKYISPGDFGGRKGKLTPSFWPESATQFGMLKTITINKKQTEIDGVRVSNVKLSDVLVPNQNYISFKIEVKKDSKLCGGLNLFGKEFGDYPQDITLIASLNKKRITEEQKEMLTD